MKEDYEQQEVLGVAYSYQYSGLLIFKQFQYFK